ncbi:MAG TPA: hypothetical protein P5186_23160 [Candidatus Paceibacterota bacterium]|nr:hypothetical protein [Verrucomicrobiota bacterium]HRY50957.1 hypothetical protein [Candidatus Paceibacterota bacterium]HSA03231.1 hypothetical protein [Candidatus Paceibacterota bacterium]
MLTVLQLIFSPAKTWMAVAQRQRGVIWIFLFSLLPLLVISGAIEVLALIKLGVRKGLLDHPSLVPQEVAIQFGLIQLGLSLVLLFGGAKFVQWIAEGFHFFPRYRQVFTTFGFGLGPIFLMRALNCVPVANTWVWWLLGVILMVFVLYQGVALVMEPEQTKGFGFYLLSTLAMVIMSGVAQAIAVTALHGKLVLE